MAETTYREIPDFLASRWPFYGNSMRAVVDDQGRYVVYSYGTVIACVHADGKVATDDRFYSKTTSRHQHLVKEYLR